MTAPALRNVLLGCALAAAAAPVAAEGLPDPTSPSDTPYEDRRDEAEFSKMAATSGAGLSDRDARFLEKAAAIGLAEVAEATLALDQAADPRILQFARTMLDEHGRGNDALLTLAEQKGIAAPAVLPDRQRKVLDSLRAQRGADFDLAYADANVEQHEDAVGLFRRAARKSDDADVRAFARMTLPKLEHHLEMAESLRKSVAERDER